MRSPRWLPFFVIGALIGLLVGCAATPAPRSGSVSVRLLKDYPDHAFNPKEYTQGMVKGGHNLLLWTDPEADLAGYRRVDLSPFGDRLLPEQDRFSYSPFVKHFNYTLREALSLEPGRGPRAIRIVGQLVECNPGSRAARFLVGLGAGKAAAAVACEVYLPGRSTPVMKIYTRDTASHGMFGGDSVAYLNHIFGQLAIRLSATLEDRFKTGSGGSS